MTQIQPITVPTKGVGTQFEIRSNGYTINPNNPQPPTFYWQVFSVQSPIDSEQYQIPVLEGNINMDVETYNQWGTDDEFVIQWACNQLGFIIV
jgi:hypothetical protein